MMSIDRFIELIWFYTPKAKIILSFHHFEYLKKLKDGMGQSLIYPSGDKWFYHKFEIKVENKYAKPHLEITLFGSEKRLYEMDVEDLEK